MDETVIVIMLKDRQTGFLEKELISCAVEKHDELLLNAYASENAEGICIVIKLTCAGEVSDEDFDAVYDYYEMSVFESIAVSCKEVEDCFNPTWEIVFKYDDSTLEAVINKILEIHANELNGVFEALKSGELDN